MSADVLPLDAFVRTIGAARFTPHSLFLGAGASISSGMPSAQMCIWEWKRDIFLTNNIGLESQFAELTLESVRARIQQWLDRQGLYPPSGHPSEYSVFIESCYPVSESRRRFFHEKIRASQPHVGYRIIGALAAKQLIRSVWTTNFDQLATRSLGAHGITPVEVGIDCTHRVVRTAHSGELIVVALHGDYRYDALKNTADELQRQEQQLEDALIHELTNTPMIVCGYSGRDDSIMQAFHQGLSRPGTAPIYWCVQDPSNVAPTVRTLLTHARAHGRTAFIVPSQGFDDLMVRLALHCLDGTGREQVVKLLSDNAGGAPDGRRRFEVTGDHPTAVIKSNAFEIECPSEAISFELKSWPGEYVWSWIRDQTRNKNVVAVPFKGQVLALGAVDEIASCFGDNIKDRPKRTPLFSDDRREDGAITSLFRSSLLKSMANAHGLATDDWRELWSVDRAQIEHHQGSSYLACNSVQLSFRQLDGRLNLILKPSVKILDHDKNPVDRSVADAIKLRTLGYQHNREFNDAVNYWRQTLLATDSPQRLYEFPPNCASTFRFLVRKAPLFAEILGNRGAPIVRVQPKLQPFLKQRGMEISEPQLLFSNKAGKGDARDPHPVRGILRNRPFDYPLTQQQIGPEVRIGVVCPKVETRILQNYLGTAERQITPGKSEADYLPTFPGFTNAFGLPLAIAEPGSAGWSVCPEPLGSDERAQCLEVARNINRCIDMLQAVHAPHVVLIFFPERWTRLRGYSTETERFDVHDFVKASSVQRGIGTQFLEQNTLADTLQCRVWWWLSLAFYVKAMRTPWVLDGLDRNSAYVGLGISNDSTREQGKQVVMGCSHIYSSRGEGLQYRLSQVENPIFYGRNPFLSRDDARRIGEQIRELFFESRSRLPDRVVIHKRTRFTRDEQLGLREGLSGVSQIDMLEVVIDDSLRYIASQFDSNGNLQQDSYPVRRGSVVRLDDFTALLWVHGGTSAVGRGRPYYQGKRRIPAPLTLRRHCGASDLRQLAEEILGLSKMNWNTFDLYTKLPATVQSSNEIARIGSLLNSFRPKTYDFRLFI